MASRGNIPEREDVTCSVAAEAIVELNDERTDSEKKTRQPSSLAGRDSLREIDFNELLLSRERH